MRKSKKNDINQSNSAAISEATYRRHRLIIGVVAAAVLAGFLGMIAATQAPYQVMCQPEADVCQVIDRRTGARVHELPYRTRGEHKQA